MSKQNKITFAMAFSVGAVLFSSHAGGGFATGNQANTYYVGLGRLGPAAAVLSMLLLTLTMRQAMVMYNSRRITSTKQLFETLFHPFDKIEILFEVFFYIMVLMAIAAAISGTASALNNYFGLNYYVGIVAVGLIVMALTIFGAGLVRSASAYMGIAILASAIAIYAIGIFKSEVSFVSRFENSFVYKNIESHTTRNAISAIFIIAVSMGISLMGLTNIIKYGYGYCGYLGIAVVVIPFLTVGVYKNRKYMKEHGEEFGAR